MWSYDSVLFILAGRWSLDAIELVSLLTPGLLGLLLLEAGHDEGAVELSDLGVEGLVYFSCILKKLIMSEWVSSLLEDCLLLRSLLFS